MAKINDKQKYPLDNNVTDNDYVIGSDGDNGGKTTNFSISSLADYIHKYIVSKGISLGSLKRTSELTNDGQDGTHPFITEQDIGDKLSKGGYTGTAQDLKDDIDSISLNTETLDSVTSNGNKTDNAIEVGGLVLKNVYDVTGEDDYQRIAVMNEDGNVNYVSAGSPIFGGGGANTYLHSFTRIFR